MGEGGTVAFILFIVFLVLKLTHVIAWSWWWVTAPLWAGAAFVSVIGIGIGIIALVTFVVHKRQSGKRYSRYNF